VAINLKINKDITPVTDLELYGVEEYWNYPVNNKGDCEDYVLLKKKILHQQAGIPLEAMLITIVRDTNNDGHAILTIRTDYGDFILDNQELEIKLWHKTGYKFLKRQSPLDPNAWLALGQGQAEAVAAASR
jgi:predicted transglutaminase-like cysteine proteinase